MADTQLKKAVIIAVKLCPFCGSKAYRRLMTHGAARVDCSDSRGKGCGISGPRRDSKIEAIKAWNRRPEETA